MNKVFEKISERLEEYEYNYLIEHDSALSKHCVLTDCDDISDCLLCIMSKAKEIVQEVAEDYNVDWIPCSERLPEEDGFYLTTVVFKGKPTTCRHLFDKNNGEWLDSEYMPFVNDDICAIIAWKPLPEPYKEGD